MTENNERDTKFLGFAKMSWRDIRTTINFVTDTGEEYFDEQVIALLAQHAYDLVYHALYETSQGMDRVFGIPYKLEQVPDLTEWPTTER